MLHPEARHALEEEAGEVKVFEDGFDIATSRREAGAAAAAEPREDVAEVRDVDADGVPCRLYRPAGALPGVVVHLHGGGFVFHDVDVHDAVARRLANRTRTALLSVDYRRPPEHRFPAAPDDVDTVLAWWQEDGPVFLHGDSAGGNLALVAALRNPGRAAGLVLLYPFLDPSAGFESYETASDGFDRREAEWYWQQYAAGPADLTDPDLAPLLSPPDRISGLPPTLVITAEHDPLRDEGEHLVGLLAEAGVPVVGTRYLGQLHGFWRFDQVFIAAEPAMLQAASFLAGLRSRQPGLG